MKEGAKRSTIIRAINFYRLWIVLAIMRSLVLEFFVECHELLPIVQLNPEVTCTQDRSQTKKRELISGILEMAVGGVARPKAVVWAVIS